MQRLCIYETQQNFKKGGGGSPAEFSWGGGGVQLPTREQFVFQINKIFSKRGGGWGRAGGPLDLPLLKTVYAQDLVRVEVSVISSDETGDRAYSSGQE